MQNAESCLKERPRLAPEIQCELLPPFDRTDLESVQHAFRSAMTCSFKQTWLDQEEAGFSPGTVRMGWRGNSLLISAELADLDIFNGATMPNQRAWELGDVFEIFLQSSETAGYVEFQITPDNQRLQLSYPDADAAGRAQKTGRLDEFLIPEEAFYSMTWVESRKCRWHVLAEIPAPVVCGTSATVESARWRFSFGRYDYTRGVAGPVISSTSPHARRDFHRQDEWGVLTFKNSLGIAN